jgi:hypothetical protein
LFLKSFQTTTQTSGINGVIFSTSTGGDDRAYGDDMY